MSKLKIKDGDEWIEVPAGGVGVPAGGSAGQILTKSSDVSYATEWKTYKYLVPDYSNRVVLTSYWGSQPTSSTTTKYTCLEDGFFYIFADRSAQGYTLFLYINDSPAMEWPANVGGMNACTLIPVRKDDTINFRTDSSSATWVIRTAYFYPLAQ